MKTKTIQYIIITIGLMLSVLSVFSIKNHFYASKTNKKVAVVNQNVVLNTMPEITTETTTTKPMKVKQHMPVEEIVYDNLTLTELIEKLNKNLYSTLDATGHYFADYTKETGLDPYLALAIVLHETGCKWGCSKFVKECNNIGGMKGTPSCNGGSYRSYNTLEEGINSYLDMIFNNYYSIGLTTPELMNPKYAESTAWAEAVNKYIETIKNS